MTADLLYELEDQEQYQCLDMEFEPGNPVNQKSTFCMYDSVRFKVRYAADGTFKLTSIGLGVGSYANFGTSFYVIVKIALDSGSSETYV